MPGIGRGIIPLGAVPVLFGLVSSVAISEELELPLTETFSGDQLDPAWEVDVSKEGTLTVENGTLKISTLTNQYAHIEGSADSVHGLR